MTAKFRVFIRAHYKAVAGLFGPAVAILAVPVAQWSLPSGADWKHAFAAAVGGVVLVYFAPANKSLD